MNSKKRFQNVCRHQVPDRFPIDYLAHTTVDKRLKQFYDIDTEVELLDILGADFYYLSCRDISQNESCFPIYTGPKLEVTETERICPFGIRFRRAAYGSKFVVDEAVCGPLENAASEKDILDHPWPTAKSFNFEPFHKECQLHNNRVIIGGFWTGILGDCYRMHGFQNFLMNIALNPMMIKTLINRMTDFYLEINDKYFSELKNKTDIWFFGNDFGTQEGLIFSKEMFREFFLENIERLISLAHSYNLKVMMHSCGAISEIMDMLINAGVDIIDPVQITAAGMKPAELKHKYGQRVVFHGGIDTQHILPNASPQTVTEHCIETLNILGTDGGYIFAPSQMLQSDITVENIDIMYKTANNYTLNGSKFSKVK